MVVNDVGLSYVVKTSKGYMASLVTLSYLILLGFMRLNSCASANAFKESMMNPIRFS